MKDMDSANRPLESLGLRSSPVRAPLCWKILQKFHLKATGAPPRELPSDPFVDARAVTRAKS